MTRTIAKPMYRLVSPSDLTPDRSNPRKPDAARLHLLRLSLSKLGFLLPIVATESGLVLSGHQRLTVAEELGWEKVPLQTVALPDKDVPGFNIMFNRVTNDYGALDTGAESTRALTLSNVVHEAEGLPDAQGAWHVMHARRQSIVGLGAAAARQYDKKSVIVAQNFLRRKIEIPLVVSESGEVVNGVHRLITAREAGVTDWPVVTIPDTLARFAKLFLNYLSMDFSVDEDFAKMLRYSAYRRAQNNRGSVPKAYRFWANGCRTLPDKDSYSTDYWRTFRELHGKSLLDFGAGLGKVAPFLNAKGFDCVDFEPYRIDPDGAPGTPSPLYSKTKAREFLQTIADPTHRLDSVFLASVMNSVPFPQDRMAVLLICHALSALDTAVYGTCRDISDFYYEYSGIRQANYFVFDSEPGVRLGDAIANPKIQKFHTQDEFGKQLGFLWNKQEFWPGGNVFYWKAEHPKRLNPRSLAQAIELEFDLPYADGTTMGLVKEAKAAFASRLSIKIP